jgi:hypothetical protein
MIANQRAEISISLYFFLFLQRYNKTKKPHLDLDGPSYVKERYTSRARRVDLGYDELQLELQQAC